MPLDQRLEARIRGAGRLVASLRKIELVQDLPATEAWGSDEFQES